MLWKDKSRMKAQHLKRLILGLIVVLAGCDVTLLFAAQAAPGEASIKENQSAASSAPSAAMQPPVANESQQLQQLQAQQLLQLQALQQPVSAQPVPGQTAVNNAQPQIQPPAMAAANNQFPNPAAPNVMPVSPVNAGANPAAVSAAGTPKNALPPLVNPDTLPAYYQSKVGEEAFNSVAQNALPMSPDQIQRLRQLFNTSQLAASTQVGVPPRPIASSQIVRLDPGTTPPVIRLGQGFVSSLVFLDSTGAPWPIEAYDVGNPTAFNIQWNRTDNTLLIQSSSLYTYGNLAVRLKGLVTPVMLTLIPGQKAIDYRVDLRVQGMGPNATIAPTGNNLPGTGSPELLGIIDGIPPAGSKAVTVSGGACQAWLYNNKLYVRTRLTVLSPAWISTMSSADGMKAYEMQKTPLLLVSQDGKVAQLKVEGL